MAITLRDTSSASSGTAEVASLAVPVPDSAVVGDLLLAHITLRSNSHTITAPAGWTSILTTTHGTSFIRSALYYRFLQVGDPTSYTWTFSAARLASGGMLALLGVDTAAPINVSGGQANASSTSATAPSITTTANDCYLIYAMAADANVSISPPPAMIEQWELHAST